MQKHKNTPDRIPNTRRNYEIPRRRTIILPDAGTLRAKALTYAMRPASLSSILPTFRTLYLTRCNLLNGLSIYLHFVLKIVRRRSNILIRSRHFLIATVKQLPIRPPHLTISCWLLSCESIQNKWWLIREKKKKWSHSRDYRLIPTSKKHGIKPNIWSTKRPTQLLSRAW